MLLVYTDKTQQETLHDRKKRFESYMKNDFTFRTGVDTWNLVTFKEKV